MVDYAQFWYGGANITYLQLANQSKNVQAVEDKLRILEINNPQPMDTMYSGQQSSSNWTAADLFLFDGVLSLANAAGNLSRVQQIDSTPIMCDRPDSAEYKAVGENILNYMRTVGLMAGSKLVPVPCALLVFLWLFIFLLDRRFVWAYWANSH